MKISYFLQVDKQYPEKFNYLNSGLPFLSERKSLRLIYMIKLKILFT